MNASLLVRIAAMAVLVTFAMSLTRGGGAGPDPSVLSYSEFLGAVRSGGVERVTLEGQRISGIRADGERFTTFSPDDSGLMGDLLEAGVAIEVRPSEQPGLFGGLFIALFPVLLLIGFWVWFLRRQMGAGGKGGPLSFGRSTARRIEGEKVNVRFADVAGVDEAKDDLSEIVAFLRDPSRFRALGGNIPRGVLMAGPPGTGKTLMARAIAGEAGVPFFTASGSDFVEMFVGVGASRVRDLFAQATKSAPCIVFIDEIDAVGRRRGAGMGGGNDEREQTLNQILVEMDGFEGNEGVIVVAATNRPDVLDPALLRPGRFDRQVAVPLPDVTGRAQILRVHMRKVPIADDVDAAVIARGTPGFSGADLANLVNEAALMAGRAGDERVAMALFDRAKDKLLMGSERRSLVMSEEDRERTAYHEAGHTIIGRLVPEHDPVHKVSIIPRGRALGVTVFLPERDRYSASRRRLESEICTLFGGRVAEEIVYGPDAVTTGAQNDIQRATQIARDMVTRYGLSAAMGPLSYEEPEEPVFLGQPSGQRPVMSDETARKIDAEVRAIIERNHARATALLDENRDALTRIAEALVKHETLDSHQIDALMAGARVPDPALDGDDGPGTAATDDVGSSVRPAEPVTEH